MRSQPAVYRGRVFVGRPGRQRLRSRRRDGLRVLVHHRAVPGALRNHGRGDRRQSRRVLRRLRRLRVRARRQPPESSYGRSAPDEHPASTVTATPVFHQGRLYVGSASREEALSVSAAYPCCTFRGSETALDAATGKVLWKRYMIPDAAKDAPEGPAWSSRCRVGTFGSRRVDRSHARPGTRHHVRDHRRQLLRSADAR